MTLAGVDVASFQGTPGQWAGVAGPIDFAAVKFTEADPGGNHYINPDAAEDWAWLKTNGKARIAYLFGRPSVPVSETVDLFLSACGHLLEDDDAVCLDLEVADGRTPGQVAVWANAVLIALHEQTGRTPITYCDLSYPRGGYCAGLHWTHLWIADPSQPAGQPIVPAPWSSWAIHQHQITGGIDRDVANYATLAAMTAALGKGDAPVALPVKPIPAPPGQGNKATIVITGANGDQYVATWDQATGKWTEVAWPVP